MVRLIDDLIPVTATMPKMKHLLRKLHIGGGAATINNHNPNATLQLPHSDSHTTTTPLPSSSSASLSPTPSPSPSPSPTVIQNPPNDVVDRGVVDFNLLQEEEFQVQLALAISASDSDPHDVDESAQIDAAKQISLGYSASLTDTPALVQFQSLRYWVLLSIIIVINLLCNLS